MYPFSSFNIPSFSFGGDLQKQIVLFLLKRTLGSFVKTEFSTDNLDFQLFQGRAALRGIEVNVEAINEKLSGQPFILEQGSIQSVAVHIPWTSILSEPCHIELEGLDFVLSPVLDNNLNGNPIASEMFKSTIEASTFQIASEFLQEIDMEPLPSSFPDTVVELTDPGKDTSEIENLKKQPDAPYLISGYMERLLSKLKITLKDIFITIKPVADQNESLNNSRVADMMRDILDDLIPNINEEPTEQESDPSPVIDQLNIFIDKIECFDDSSNSSANNSNLKSGEKMYYRKFILHELQFKLDSISDPIVWGTGETPHELLLELKVIPQPAPPPYQHLNISNSIQARLRSTIKPIVISINSDQLDSLNNFIKFILPNKPISSQDSSIYCPPSPSTYFKQPIYSPNDYSDSFISSDPTMEVNFDIILTSIQIYILHSRNSPPHDCSLPTIQKRSHLGIDLSRIDIKGSYTSHMYDSSSNTMNLNTKFKSFKIWEYLASVDYPEPDSTKVKTWPRDTYLPIIGFDPNLPNSTAYFDLMDNNQNVSHLTGLPSFWSRTKQNTPNSKKSNQIPDGLLPPWDSSNLKNSQQEHISIQLETNNKNGLDISINAEPLWLRIDARMVDRLENLIGKVLPKDSTANSHPGATHRKQRRNHSYSEQNIIHDLDRRTSLPAHHSTIPRLDLRTDFIRILICTPSGVFDDDDFRNHRIARIHQDVWIMDVKSPLVTLPISENQSTISNIESRKVKIEYEGLDLFLHNLDTNHYHSFMNISPSTESLGLPNLEITINSSAKPTPGYRNHYSQELPIPFPKQFDDFFEDKVKVTDLDDDDEIMGFKQSTIETSLFVVNCHFPNLKIEMSPYQYDAVMAMVTDISSWEPCFLKTNAASACPSPDPADSVTMESSFYTANDYEGASSIFSTRPPQMLNTIHEAQEPLSMPSMLSLVVFMPHIDIVLTFDNELTDTTSRRYTLTFQECRFFSVTKFQGKTQSYCVIDSEDLFLFDDSDEECHRCVISPTIPFHKKPCLSLTFFSKIIPPVMNRKNASLSLAINGIDIRASLGDERLITDLISFANTESKISSSRSTQLSLRMNTSLLDISCRYRPINLDTEILYLIQDCALSTHITPNVPSIWLKVGLQSSQLLTRDFQIEDQAELLPSKPSYYPYSNSNIPISTAPSSLNAADYKGFEGNVFAYWKSVGFCSVFKSEFLKLNINLTPRTNSLPLIQLDVWSQLFKVGLCADSLNVLMALVEYLSKQGDRDLDDSPPPSPPPPPPEYNETLDESLHFNILESLDQEAFSVSKTNLESSQTEVSMVSQRSPLNDHLELFEGHYQNDENVPSDEGWQKDGFSSSDTSPTGQFSYKGPLEGDVKILDNEPFTTLEEYFSVPDPLMDGQESIDLDLISHKLRIHDLNLLIELYDGHDFPAPSTHASTNPSTSNPPAHTRSKSSSSATLRPLKPSIEIHLTSIKAHFYKYLDGVCSDSVRFRGSIKDLEILDNIPTSNWNKFMTHLKSDYNAAPRDSTSSMFQLEFQGIKPIIEKPPIEYRLRVSILPIRLYIDQDAVLFLLKFFNIDLNPTANSPSQPSKSAENSQANTLYFQNAEISPLKIKVDYKPKHMDLHQLKEGNLVELVNLFPLEDATMVLDRVKVKGVRGVDKLIGSLVNSWLPHIASTQIPGVVSGVAPIRTLVNLGTGVADLILLPFDQYKKDGRIVKGIQHGVSSFARTTTSEAVKLGTKIAMGAQVVLEQADSLLSPNISIEEAKSTSKTVTKFAQQPSNVNEGMELAYRSLKKNWGSAYKTVLAIPVAVQEPTGTQGKMKAVIRAIPVAMIKPMLGATEAVSMTLLGLRNSLDPDRLTKLQDKYKQK